MTDENKPTDSREAETPAQAPAPRPRRHRAVRIILRTLLCLIVAILLIPVLLYIPPVQTFVKNIACSMLSKSTGMNISVGKFRLAFPLKLDVADVLILEQSGDTMLAAGSAKADIAPLPLLKLDVQLRRLSLQRAYYRMVSPDSSMILKLRAADLALGANSSIGIKSSQIDITRAEGSDGDVSLYMNPWKVQPQPVDSTAPLFLINIAEARLRNFDFAMSMLPTIDTLRVHMVNTTLTDGIVNLRDNLITASRLTVDGGNATYIAPTPEYVASHPLPASDSTSTSAPYVVKADSIALNGFKALYAIKGASPLPGFDANYISMDSVGVGLRNFYNKETTVRLPLTRVEGIERSGLRIVSGRGLVAVDSTGIALDSLHVRTTASQIQGSASIPFALMELQPDAALSAKVSGSIGMSDANAFMPDLRTYTAMLPADRPLNFDLEANGTLSDIDVPRLWMEIPAVLQLEASGSATDPLDMKKMTADLDFDGSLSSPQLAQRMLGMKDVHVPAFRLSGSATADHMNFGADFDLHSTAGQLVGRGHVGMNSETYSADITTRALNVGAIMPSLGVGKITASIKANGAGFNPTLPHARTSAHIHVADAEYSGHSYKDITADATLADGDYTLTLTSPDPDADISLTASGHIAEDLYTIDATADIRNADLQALGISPTTNGGRANIILRGTLSPERWLYNVDLHAENIDWRLPDNAIRLSEGINLHFVSTDSTVNASLAGRQLNLAFSGQSGLKPLIDAAMGASDTLSAQLAARTISIDALQRQLPPFDLNLDARGTGLLRYLTAPAGMTVDTLWGHISNRAETGLGGNIGINRLAFNNMTFDTARFTLKQNAELLDYALHVGNRANNLPEFHAIDLSGYIGTNRLAAFISQRNTAGKTGYRLGLTAALRDSTVTVHFTPLKATIAYMPWTFNLDNHVDYTFGGGIDANLMAKSAESSISLRTALDDKGRNQLLADLNNIRVQDFLKMSVFAPPLTATINSSLRLRYLKDRHVFIGSADVGVKDFTYDRMNVGNFDLRCNAGASTSGDIAARAALLVDSVESLVLRGVVRTDTASKRPPLQLELLLNKFPLKIANPFLAGMVKLSGDLNGRMRVGGSFTDPKLQGAILFDSVGANVPMIGSTLRFARDSVAVDSNVIRFRNFSLVGLNGNALALNGTVDARRLTDIRFDLTYGGQNLQLVGNDRRARSDIYGKLFANINGSVRGPMRHFDVRANIDILSSTDVAYNIPTVQSAITQRTDQGVVKFVEFNDTTTTVKADSTETSMAMRIIANLTIQPGARATVDLSTNGTDRVELSPSGTLNYFQNFMGDMRLSGTLLLGNGFARYNIPVMGEKMFTFDPESSVTWNGDLMNPAFNIKATDHVKANVTGATGNSRLITFDVRLNVGGNLTQPKILFDLSTRDDMTVQNELSSMSADQRSTQAMNLLLYGQYTGPGVKANANLTNNPLYGFLESQLNSWAANNIRGVDLSFGIDQYDRTIDGESSTAMSYSYKVSKSLFSNKLKIVVGGSYSTDASADENFSQNLFNDISFEYMIKQSATLSMYLKLFRHTGFESILEGEITEMGVGFVMRRRLNSLLNLFDFRRRKDLPTVEPADSTDSTTDRPDK